MVSMKGIRLRGMDDMVATLKRLPKQFLDVSAAAQYNAAQKTMGLSVLRVPFEMGDLEASAYVDMPRYTAKGVMVDFGYYGPDYIVRQHENLDYNHPGLRSTNPSAGAKGQAKYLASAVNEMEDETERMIQAAIDRFLATGVMPRRNGPFGPKGEK